jgi:hypothetical protein
MEKRLGNTALEHKYETGEKKKKRALWLSTFNNLITAERIFLKLDT